MATAEKNATREPANLPELRAALQKAGENANHPRDTVHRRKPWMLTQNERRHLTDLWLALGADPAALAAVGEQAGDVMAALLQNAANPTANGYADRAVVLRMLGVGYLLPDKKANGPVANGVTLDRRVSALAERMAARLSQAASGRISVSPGRIIEANPLEGAEVEGDTHKTDDPVRMPEPQAAAIAADPPADDGLDLDWG